MNKLLISALAAFVLCTTSIISCVAPTQVVSSWRDPNVSIQNPSAHKIVVAALIYDQGVRRQVVDYMASLYPGVAAPSYTVLGGDSLLSNEAAATSSLTKLG
jgi:hypothetical protein